MSEPAIKGTAYAGVVEDLMQLLQAGRVTHEQVESRLTAQDLEILSDKISAGFWYPLASYLRLLDVLIEHEGQANPRAYLHRRGERAVQRLLDSGLYQQFQAMKNGWQHRTGRMMMTLAGFVYNVGEWNYVAETDATGGPGDRFCVEIDDAWELPDPVRFTIEGAILAIAQSVADSPVRVDSDRPSPSKIVFHVTREALCIR